MRLEAVPRGNRGDGVEGGLRPGDVGDGDGAVEGDDGRGVQRVERIVVAEDARPVGRGDGGRSAVNRGDAGLEVIFAQVGALCG